MMTAKFEVSVPKAVALKHRFRFHAQWLAAMVLLPVLLYDMFFYLDAGDLLKYELPIGCLLAFDDQKPWWMMPPPFIILGGISLYCAAVWIFSNKDDDSGIVNLVKNSDRDAMFEINI